MLTVTIFTYKRINLIKKCLKSLKSKHISEILIFNDDEKKLLKIIDLDIDDVFIKSIKIFNPQDFGFSDRNFRKPIYLNKAISLAKNDFVLFSDDDGIFKQGAIDQHINALEKYPFSAGGIIRNRFIPRISKSILQGTNYAFRKFFFNQIGKYDEKFIESMGGGDVDFWYRIYNYVKNNDSEYIMKSISGFIFYKNNIDECYKKQDIITSDLKNMFSNNVEFSSFKSKYRHDESGKSFVKYNDFYFTNGGAIRVICFDMNKDFIDPNDQLYLAINSKKFLDWLNKNM